MKTKDYPEEEISPKKDFNIGKIISLVFLGIFIAIFLVIIFDSMYTVPAGERAIVLTFQKPNMVPQEEGLHFKYPLIQSVILMNIQVQKYDAPASAASKDLQTVSTQVTLNYHLVPSSTPEIYKNIGINYQDKIIQPAVQEIVKASTAQYTAEELITRRSEVKDKIDLSLQERLLKSQIIVDQISITNFDFSPEFNKAIESKVTAEQNALAEKNKVAQIEYQAKQKIAEAEGTKQSAILEAQGKAESIRIQSEAIKAQGGKEYVDLQAIQKWDGKMPQFMMGNGATPFINIPTSDIKQ